MWATMFGNIARRKKAFGEVNCEILVFEAEGSLVGNSCFFA